jgi:hypothetical protein
VEDEEQLPASTMAEEAPVEAADTVEEEKKVEKAEESKPEEEEKATSPAPTKEDGE